MFAILSRFEIAVTIGVLGAIGLVLIARSLAPRRELTGRPRHHRRRLRCVRPATRGSSGPSRPGAK